MTEFYHGNYTGNANAMCRKNAEHKNVKVCSTCNKRLSKHLDLWRCKSETWHIK